MARFGRFRSGEGVPGVRRQALRFLLGLSLLLFAGYVVGWRSLRLEPGNAVVLLGEDRLVAGAPAAFRVVGLAPGGDRQIALTGVELTIEQAGSRATLARRLPEGGVVDLNVRIPDWPAGRAELGARVDTTEGSSQLAAEVVLVRGASQDAALGKKRALDLSRPSAEWRGPPAWFARRRGPAPGESGDLSDSGAPASFQLYPAGGRLADAFPTRVQVRTADRAGRPARGTLSLDGRSIGRADAEGMSTVLVEAGASGPLKLRFESPNGMLEGELDLKRDDAPMDLAVRPGRLTAGQPLEVQIRAARQTGETYLDAWWTGGWCAAAHARLADGRAAIVLPVPAGIEGPLVVRVRGEPAGGEPCAVRRAVVWVGRERVPSVSQAFAGLVRLTRDGVFWSECASLLTGGRGSLTALLSRVRAPAGPLPVLTDNRRSSQHEHARRRSSMASFAIWLVACVSVLWLMVLAWLLFSGMPRREAKNRRRRLWGASVALAAVGAAFFGGWIWLYLNCG